MPCDRMSIPGGVAVVCSRGQKRSYCIVCASPATLLCDGPPPAGVKRKTCDAPLCRSHAKHVGPDRDLCPGCAAKRAEVEGEQLQMTFGET